MSSSPFKNLHKSLQLVPASSHPLQLDAGLSLLNILQDHREQLIENKEQKLTLSAAHEKRYYQGHYKALSSAQYYSVSVSMTSSWSSINFDEKLKLEKHRQSLSNGIKKLNALARLVSCMIIAKWLTLMNAFFLSCYLVAPTDMDLL